MILGCWVLKGRPEYSVEVHWRYLILHLYSPAATTTLVVFEAPTMAYFAVDFLTRGAREKSVL